jgi:hypothetical protein
MKENKNNNGSETIAALVMFAIAAGCTAAIVLYNRDLPPVQQSMKSS